jgi:dGTPase
MVRMDWNRLLSSKRIGKMTPSASTHVRSKFESDVDRIVFSSAFRRLSRKTQVHPLAVNDHIHNRLSHSLEVARVGASLGKAVGLKIKNELPQTVDPSDLATIVHAACLAHDIGNPPFGHAGESAIKNWFVSEGPQILKNADLSQVQKNDLYHYEGNAQGFRILTQTENHFLSGGLQLTAATLGTFLKYPWTSEHRTEKDKFGAFLSEASILGPAQE